MPYKIPHFNKHAKRPVDTSWQKSSKWYSKIVGDGGHYYHEHVILPSVTKLLQLTPTSRLLDVGCGEGVLARAIPNTVAYTGVDAASSLIRDAKFKDKNKNHEYVCADATFPFLAKKDFTHATIILALQNMAQPGAVLKNISARLVTGGKLVIVLNHPMFRIPRQSGWETQQQNDLQVRWISRYLSPMKIPIEMHPGKGQASGHTWSFHEPLSAYSQHLHSAGFVIETIEEWASDKKSTSRFAKREDRARAEIPLFMCIVAKKA